MVNAAIGGTLACGWASDPDAIVKAARSDTHLITVKPSQLENVRLFGINFVDGIMEQLPEGASSRAGRTGRRQRLPVGFVP